MRAHAVTTAIAIAAALAAPVAASPGDDVGTDGMTFAGVTGADPANVTTNPAALIRIEPGVHGFVLGRFALHQLRVERLRVDPGDGSLGPGPDVSESRFGAGYTVGVAWTTSRSALGLSTSLRPPDETMTDPAVSDHSRGSRTRRFDIFSIGLAFRITNRLSFGAGAAFVDRYQRLAFSRDTALEAGRDPMRGVGSDCAGAPCGLEDPAARELWTVDVTRALRDLEGNFMLSVGALARLPRGVLFGVGLERPLISSEITMSGDARIVRAPRDGGGVLEGDAELRQTQPEIWRAGARGLLSPGWELLGELRWRRLHRADRVDLRLYGGDFVGDEVPEWTLRPLGLRDAIAMELGAEQIDTGQPVRWGARLAYDTGAVSEDRLSPRAPWGQQLTAGAGVQLRFERWIVQVGYRVDWQPPASTDGSAFDPIARIDCVEADYDYDLPACATVRAGYGTSTAAGTYGRWSHGARVALRFVIR